jgi:hypothetical protein
MVQDFQVGRVGSLVSPARQDEPMTLSEARHQVRCKVMIRKWFVWGHDVLSCGALDDPKR